MRDGYHIPSSRRAARTVATSSVVGAVGKPAVGVDEVNGADYSGWAVAVSANFTFDVASGKLLLGCQVARVVAASTHAESTFGTRVRSRLVPSIVSGFQVPEGLFCHRSLGRSTAEARYIIGMNTYLWGASGDLPIASPSLWCADYAE